jgi:hypothetical protein
MTCEKCIARSLFDDGPCQECQIKSASENKNEISSWARLHRLREQYQGVLY